MHPFLQQCVQWYIASAAEHAECVCPTRDVFQARLDSFYRSLISRHEPHGVALLTAIVGEIGNNAFDHNLGKWRDIAGCWFQYVADAQRYWMVVADRGQGMLASLRVVDPTLDSDQAAIETAFRKQISGRSPEQRGNGLKFVRSVINAHTTRGACCLSGTGRLSFGGLSQAAGHIMATPPRTAQTGTLILIVWDML